MFKAIAIARAERDARRMLDESLSAETYFHGIARSAYEDPYVCGYLSRPR